MNIIKYAKPLFLYGPSAYLPERIVDNDTLMAWMGSKARGSFIAQKTGVLHRRWASDEQACSDLAVAAGEALFHAYPICRENIGHLILCTTSGDFLSPPTAPLVQHRLGLQGIGAFDVGAACAGFVSGLHVGGALSLVTGKSNLVIASEIRSKFLSPTQFNTVALFGDAAGACVISNDAQGSCFKLLGSALISSGEIGDLISIPGGGSRQPASKCKSPDDHCLRMRDGAAVFVKAIDGMHDAATAFLAGMQLTLADVAWIVPHQANEHLMRALCRKLEFPQERLVETISFTGNTSGASVAVALSHLLNEKRACDGEKILLLSAGGGGLAACALLERIHSTAAGDPSC